MGPGKSQLLTIRMKLIYIYIFQNDRELLGENLAAILELYYLLGIIQVIFFM